MEGGIKTAAIRQILEEIQFYIQGVSENMQQLLTSIKLTF